MKTGTLIKLFLGLSVVLCLISAGITFAIVSSVYNAKYSTDEELRKEFDSLMIVLSIKDKEVKQIRYAYDSIIFVSANQSREIDSLIKAKEIQKNKNEKKYRNIANLPDDKLNSILSGKLK